MQSNLLTKGQLYLLIVLTTLSIFILGNSAYLYITSPAASESLIPVGRYDVSTYGMMGTDTIRTEIDDPHEALPAFYQIMLLTHLGGGLLLVVVASAFAIWHVPEAWRRRNANAITAGIALTAVFLLLAVSGLFILTESNSLQNQWIFYSHRGLAVALPFMYIAHRAMAYSAVSRTKLAYASIGLVVLIGALMAVHHYSRTGSSPVDLSFDFAHTAYAAEADAPLPDDPFIPFNPGNLGYPESRFFPSAVTTTSGDYLPRRQLTLEDVANDEVIANDIETYGFVVNESMGSATCKRCHAGTVEQWARSAHRFSSFNNPFYKASVENLRDEPDGHKRSQWCGACHDPVLMFGGKMLDEIDPLWPEAQAGLTCLSCHTIDAIHGKEGNGNYNISDESPSPYLFNESKDGLRRMVHDYLIKAKPTVHKNQMLKPFFRTSEFCLPCHKVSLDVPINNYKWIRGQNEYDNWHDSGVARNAARTFYLPANERTCQDCHMPLEPVRAPDVSAKDGMIKSHTFFAANTALPWIRGDHGSLKEVEAVLQNDAVLIDVFAYRTASDLQTPMTYLTLDGENSKSRIQPAIPPLDEEIQFDVIVRNFGVGHTFPGGTLDSNECWVEFQLIDADGGAVLFESGGLDADKVVDPAAHFYKALFVDKDSNPALVRDPQNFHAPVYVRVIGPGTADLVSFRVELPQGWQDKRLIAQARLLWRKFNTPFTEFVKERESFPFTNGELDLPITEIAVSRVPVRLSESAPEFEGESLEQLAIHDPRPEWMRYNDYGIAHFLQENNQLAFWAFSKVDELAPEKPDGPRNLARIALREGDVEEAYDLLAVAEARSEGDPQTAWFWGMAKKEEGLYDEAASAFERVIAYFPEERSAFRELGRTHYLNGDYRRSLEAYLKVLAIDPEDRVAHYHRMLCYRALGERDKADEAQKAYEKYQIDERAQEFTQAYRLRNDYDNAASQRIRVIELKALNP